MHFSIPDTQELTDTSGSKYCAYNIHINGVFHCTVRYKQLHNFYEQLKKVHGIDSLPHFPPKKLLPLSESQRDERRILLERFIQLISQHPKIASSEEFNGFFLAAQQETQEEDPADVTLDIYLMNGHKISINIISTDKTDDVLETVAQKIELNEDYVYYFALYLIKSEDDGEVTIIRKIQEFESPYISLRMAGANHRVVVRKSYWDPSLDDHLIDDRVAMNLLYVQAISDVERGWTVANKETCKQLATLQSKGSKKEYLMFARTLKYYGYIQFKPCVADYPEANTRVIISAGNKELCFKIHIDRDQIKEAIFRVTRMRCWRITTALNKEAGESEPHLEFSFEYLMSKDNLQWVTVVTNQSILLSMCLQGMVDELIMKKQGTKIAKPSDRVKENRHSYNYMKRDGSTHAVHKGQNGVNEHSNATSPRALASVKKFSLDKFSTRQAKPSIPPSASQPSPIKAKSLVENDAFEGIGDDDL